MWIILVPIARWESWGCIGFDRCTRTAGAADRSRNDLPHTSAKKNAFLFRSQPSFRMAACAA